MTREEALEASIAKWEKLATAETLPERPLAKNCPLCELYYQNACMGCPVFVRTGLKDCRDSPYWAAKFAHTAWEDGRLTGARFRDAARKEANFLKSLRRGQK